MLVSTLKKIKARGRQESVWAGVMEILLHGVFREVSLFQKTWASEALRKEQVAGLWGWSKFSAFELHSEIQSVWSLENRKGAWSGEWKSNHWFLAVPWYGTWVHCKTVEISPVEPGRQGPGSPGFRIHCVYFAYNSTELDLGCWVWVT